MGDELFWHAQSAISAGLNTLLTAAEYDYILRDCQARVLIVHDKLWAKVAPVVDQQPFLEHIIVVGAGNQRAVAYRDWIATASPILEAAATHREDFCTLNYSRGTTGQPKGILHAHKDLPLAEEILAKGQADLVGFARALLADPDFPKKARLGLTNQIVRCIYGNVCKALDEKFKKVTCTLWLKHGLNAPIPAPDDIEPPTWPKGGEIEASRQENGRIRLKWEAGEDRHDVYGYEVFRAVNGGPFAHLTSSTTNRHIDMLALAGNRYTYHVRAYDFAGNRSQPSQNAQIVIPLPAILSENVLQLDGETEARQGY